MSSSTASPLVRCKALALAAMIAQGGKPCWVAAYAPADSPVAGAIPVPRVRKPSLAPQYRPRRAPRATVTGPVAAPPIGGGLTAAERQQLAGIGPKLLAAIERALDHIERGPTAAARQSLPAAMGRGEAAAVGGV